MSSTTPEAGRGRWESYLGWFHARHPGITEAVLSASEAGDPKVDPYRWLLATVPRSNGTRVLDVACGSGPLLQNADSNWIGIDRSSAELAEAAGRTTAPLLHGDVCALPFPDAVFDAVVCSMGIMVFAAVAPALEEMTRVLSAAGTAHFLLPGSFPLTVRDRWRYVKLLGVLRQLRPAYPNQVHLSGLHNQLRRAGLVVTGDERIRFRYPIDTKSSAAIFVNSLYTPRSSPALIERAQHTSARWTGSEIGIPLRRLVCQKGPPG